MNYVRIPFNFAALPSEFSSYERAGFVVVPIPYDVTESCIPGARFGPRAIISASRNLELFDEELRVNIGGAGIATLDEPVISVIPEEMKAIVREMVSPIIADKKIPLVLGGEHSISVGVVEELKEHSKGMSVLQIDAHADLRDKFDGSSLSHACVMRRIAELCPTVQVGIRSVSDDEMDFIRDNKLKLLWAYDIRNRALNSWVKEAVSRLSDNVYITIDLDGLDTSIMPAVGTPEPGGLLWHEVTHLLRSVAEKRHVIGFDVVGLCPCHPASEFTAARLVMKMIAYIHYYKRARNKRVRK
ncbi:agmatinase [Candidatus Woesearchaeota archaeon CG08_land_8_20_14_0_20_47_9]|nr:MAG: agmatinase [Candidatus Woesearchaeota archaeon CG1_02_47_18]PIN73026.1 MAG: agmatinase [Candidatus Woesearchaeota archaeon CG10_big_fil_rev_8_21_14_0_10_47_5]PIO04189.1 MAG: agmatinase [Candidatus Woesearchaeota archaeon CG08_land_8_20_14_0_20_47_9]HII29874.1 agmatinase [Candidatus Woesearchaeota archaeon]